MNRELDEQPAGDGPNSTPAGTPPPLPPPDDDAPFGAGLVDGLEAPAPPARQSAEDAGQEEVPDEQLLDEAEEADAVVDERDASPGSTLPDEPAREVEAAILSHDDPSGRTGAPPLDESPVPAEDVEASPVAPPQRPVRDTWDRAATPRHLAIELKRIEARITSLLEGVDPRRKRRLEGTRRWLELQDDIAAIRFDGRIDEARVREINALCAKRHRLFHHLNFLVATRPTWNT